MYTYNSDVESWMDHTVTRTPYLKKKNNCQTSTQPMNTKSQDITPITQIA